MTPLRGAWLALALLAGCVVRDESADTPRARIDTSNGLLASTPTRVDSTPASTVPRPPAAIGPDSVMTARSVAAAAAAPLDTITTLTAIDSAPATLLTGTDLDVLRRELLIPVQGVAAAQLRDSYTESRGSGRPHDAIDIPAPRGTPVLSAAGGRVLRLFESRDGGHMIYAADSTQRFILMYAHLDTYQPGLAAGQTLRRGQLIGTVGSSGNASPTVPHLHFAIARSSDVRQWWKGLPVNPYPLLRLTAAP